MAAATMTIEEVGELSTRVLDGRRTLVELNKAIKNIDQHPTRLIFGH